MGSRWDNRKIDDDGRECSKCGEYKPWSDYFKKVGAPHGYATECKVCRRIYDAANRARRNEAIRAWRQAHPQKMYLYSVKSKYGLDPADYLAMLEVQGGLCAACQREEVSMTKGKVRRLSVDHNHTTKVVRGLLCNPCNRTIGYSEDDPDRLEACAAYLRGATSDS